MTSEEEGIMFRREDEHIQDCYDDKYVIGEYQCLYFKHPSNYEYVLIILVSLTVASISSLPYSVYNEFLPQEEWGFICILRPIIYTLVFSGYIIYELSRVNIVCSISCQNYSLLYYLRHFFSALFSFLYTFLYCIKWLETDNIPLGKVSISIFVISWIVVYYSVIDKHISSIISTSGVSSSYLSNQRRISFLNSINQLQDLCYFDSKLCNNVYYKLSQQDQIYFAKIANCSLTEMEVERVHLYEEDQYDNVKQARINIVNIMLGISIVPLTISFIEDYGYPLHRLFNTSLFLWIACILCSLLSMLYITATYPIYHKLFTLSFECKRGILYKIIHTVNSFILILLASSIASTRLTSSYNIFGRIAGHMQMPHEMGITFIWSCTIIVFLIDLSTCLKITSCAIKRWLCVVAMFIGWCCKYFDITPCHLCKYYIVRYYFKYMKSYVRSIHEDLLVDVL